MKKIITNLSLCIAAACVVSACLVPEKFSAKLDVRPDATYTFVYSGTAVHALAAAQIKETGSLSEKDEKGLKQEADKLSKNPDIRKASYKGSGRYELEVEAKRKDGQSLRMLDIFSVRTDKNGVMTISSNEIKEKDKRELEKLGIAISGVLSVSLPKNAEVISHNATSTPTMGFGTYSWKIGRVDQQAMMKVRIKQEGKSSPSDNDQRMSGSASKDDQGFDGLLGDTKSSGRRVLK